MDTDNNFFNANNYYLVDIFNGRIKRSKINFRIINNSSYNLKNAKQVEIESNVKKINSETGKEYYELIRHTAFIKSTNNNYSDNLDVINSEIASLLGLSSSKVYHLETDTEIKGIINIDLKKSDEQDIRMDKLINRILSLVKTKNIEMTEWLKDYINSANNKTLDDNNLKNIIELPLNIIKLFFNLTEAEKALFLKDYIKMIFFDLLTNNKYRNLNSYSILLDYKGKYSRFTPIFDYNNELNNADTYELNNIIISKSSLLSCIYKNYYPYIRDLSRGLTENYSTYIESINLIIDCNLDEVTANIIKKNIMINYETIKSLEIIHEQEYDESKMDVAMTQTYINLNAVNNNQIVHHKYDNFNKEKELDVKLDDTITVKVEPQKLEKKNKHLFLFILILVLLCGIAIGIAYLLMLNFA